MFLDSELAEYAPTRIYVLNARNKILLGFFALLTLVQLIIGILMVVMPHNTG